MEELNMSREELKKFFNKYNSLELEKLNTKFKFVYIPEIKGAKKVLEEVYTSKQSKATTFDKSYRIKELTEKELEFLYELIYDEIMGLSCIKTPEYTKEIDSSSKLLSSIEYEIESKKTKKVKTLRYNK